MADRRRARLPTRTRTRTRISLCNAVPERHVRVRVRVRVRALLLPTFFWGAVLSLPAFDITGDNEVNLGAEIAVGIGPDDLAIGPPQVYPPASP